MTGFATVELVANDLALAAGVGYNERDKRYSMCKEIYIFCMLKVVVVGVVRAAESCSSCYPAWDCRVPGYAEVHCKPRCGFFAFIAWWAVVAVNAVILILSAAAWKMTSSAHSIVKINIENAGVSASAAFESLVAGFEAGTATIK